MDIINVLPENKFESLDDLLTFISIYDDENRTKAYFSLLERYRDKIRDKVCLEIGAGAGIISEKLAQLGAKKVYAVERNEYLFQLAKKRLSKYSNVEVVNQDIREFIPPQSVDLVVQELFGQLLYDEDIYVLLDLKFEFTYLLPNRARLRAGVVFVDEFEDEFVNSEMIQFLDGVLVSGLFDEEGLNLEIDVMEFDWGSGKILTETEVDISDYSGDLLYFGLEILDDREVICRAGECPNWSFVWTYRAGNKFKLKFKPTDRGSEVYFEWIE